MKEVEKALKALANRRRLAIIQYLRRAEKATVGDIAREIRVSFKATSKHLGVLTSADLVEHEQVSRQIYYFLVRPIHPLIRTIFYPLK